MITALATVVTVEEAPSGYNVGVTCEQQTSCSHCSSQKSCGTGIVSKAVGNKSHAWRFHTEEQVQPGQIIEIGLPEKNLIQFASIVYILPILALITGAVVGQSLVSPVFGGGEGWTILLSGLFMAAGVWLARRLSTKLQSKSEQVVILLRVLGSKVDIVNI
jgi:sigma-E factor negative regulatory protein RseC